MANTPERAEFWKEFILTRCQFPRPERLRAQFAAATLSDFCSCGCNSFRVDVPASAGVDPIAQPSLRTGTTFEANFWVDEQHGTTLDVILFADESGNLSYVEIDYCVNSFPVPDEIAVTGQPYAVRTSPTLIT
jgi:hypothetical protein